LEVGRDNPAAIALYEGLGFARVGVRRAYYDRGAAGRADALVMRLDLNSSTASPYVQGGPSRRVDLGPD
jgi:ribosomal-protein-alanine N-acetyltransferase